MVANFTLLKHEEQLIFFALGRDWPHVLVRLRHKVWKFKDSLWKSLLLNGVIVAFICWKFLGFLTFWLVRMFQAFLNSGLPCLILRIRKSIENTLSFRSFNRRLLHSFHVLPWLHILLSLSPWINTLFLLLRLISHWSYFRNALWLLYRSLSRQARPSRLQWLLIICGIISFLLSKILPNCIKRVVFLEFSAIFWLYTPTSHGFINDCVLVHWSFSWPLGL